MSETFSYERNGFSPGWIFILDPHTTALDDPDWHPYLLLTHCGPGGPAGILAFGTGQDTEAGHGAPHATIPPRIGGRNDNALEKPTRFYPVVLVQQLHEDLPRPTHHVFRGGRPRPRAARVFGTELNAVRALLVPSLGLGSGSAGDPHPPRGSWRGRIASLSEEYHADTGVRFALILTAHRYSAEERYQVLVPIVPGDGKEAPVSVVRAAGKDWIQLLGPNTRTALLVVPAVETVWHRTHLGHQRGEPVFIDAATLREVEARIAQLFGI